MESVNIAIIGGGLVGASLALALQQGARERGWRIALIEPFAPGDAFQPSYDARASALAHGSQQIYQRLGVWEQVAQRAQAIEHIHISEQGRFAAAELHASEQGVSALGQVVENAWLGHCLWKILDREIIDRHCPARVTRMQAQQNGYQLQLDSGQMLNCQLAILADGGRSGLRQQLGIHSHERDYGQTAIITTVTPAQPHDNRAFERFTPDGPMALLPMTNNRFVLIWTRVPNEAERLAALPEREFLGELQNCFGYRMGNFVQVGQRHLYPLSLVQSSEQVRSNLVVLGNAAHSLHPIAGQGYNLSLRDAMALADTLLASNQPLGDLATLQSYAAGQQLDQDLTIGFSDQVTRLFSNRTPGLSQARRLGLLGLELCPPAKNLFARQAMGLGSKPAQPGSFA